MSFNIIRYQVPCSLTMEQLKTYQRRRDQTRNVIKGVKYVLRSAIVTSNIFKANLLCF